MSTNKQDSRFLAISYDLLNAVGFIDQEGNQVPLTLTDKIIYSHMKSRFDYFRVEKKSDYYDTQEAIADALNIDRTTVVRRLKRLIKHGAIIGFKKKNKNFQNWNYTSIPKIKLYRIVDGVVVPIKPTPIKDSVKPEVHVLNSFDDDSDLPF